MFKIIRPILLITIAVLTLLFFVRPMIGEVQQLREEQSGYSEVVAKATEFNTLLGTLVAQREALKAADLERIDTFVPKNVDEVRALIDLQHLAEFRGMSFKDISTDLAVAGQGDVKTTKKKSQDIPAEDLFGGKLISRDITFGVTGTYEQFRAFIGDLERSLVLMEVTNISFKGSTLDNDIVDYAVTVRLYALPDTATSTATTQ